MASINLEKHVFSEKSKFSENHRLFFGKFEHSKLRQFNEFNEDQVRSMRPRRFSVSSKISPFTEEVEDSLSRGSWWTSHWSFGITTLSVATACQNGDHSSIKRHRSFNRKTTQSITNKGLHFDVFFSSPKVKILKKTFTWISICV